MSGTLVFREIGGELDHRYEVRVAPANPGDLHWLRSPQVLPLWSDDEVVHGRDARPTDGTVLIVERDGGEKLVVGDRCQAGSEGCNEPVEALFKLREVHAELLVFLGLRADQGGSRTGQCEQL